MMIEMSFSLFTNHYSPRTGGESVYIYLNKIDSTNEEAKRRIRANKIVEDSLVVADTQSAGKGQLGRKWVSKKDVGIYMSIIKKTNLPLKDIQEVTLVAGLTVHEVLSKYLKSYGLKLKYPNDVLVNGKKLCGILTESISRDNNYLIVGIGINVNNKEFPQIEGNVPTSLHLETGNYFSRKDIVTAVTKKFYENFEKYIVKKENYNDKYEKIALRHPEER